MKREHLVEIFWALWPLIVISFLSLNLNLNVNVDVKVEECE